MENEKFFMKESAVFEGFGSVLFLVLQNVSSAAVQGFADGSQGGEADGSDLVVFDFGQVYVGDAHLLGQLV